MEIDRKGDTFFIKNKELDNLDKLVLDFVRLMPFDYVIISGYIAILFGRSRTTEDVDLFIEPKSEKQFLEFCEALRRSGFNLLNAEDANEGYLMMNEGSSLRVVYGGAIFPNFELKLPRSNIAKITMAEKTKVVINNETINTSSLELQIAYKLYLGSDKDFDDARHLYRLLKDKLDIVKFKYFLSKINVDRTVIKDALGENIEV
jgi:hypothetical protein